MKILEHYQSRYLKKFGFDDPKEQDFYNDFLTDDGVQISVMKYRNKLKGPDPYPEDYF